MSKSLVKTVSVLAGLAAGLCSAGSALAADNWSIPVTNTGPNGEQTHSVWKPIETSKITKSWRICALFPHLKDSYWLAVDYGVSSEAKRDGAAMQLYQAGGYTNLSTQLNQMDNCIAQRFDAIVLGAISKTGVNSVVDKAAKAHIPVIDVSNGIDDPNVAGHALVSWYEAGKLLGKYIVKSSNGQTVNIGWFPGPEGAGFSDDANRGFSEAVKGASNVKIVDTRRGDTGLNVQLDLIQNALQAYPNINYLAGVDIAAQAAVVAVRNTNQTGKIKVGAYVIIPPVYDAIGRGAADAAVTDFTVMQGRMAVDMAIRTLQGQTLPAKQSGPKLTIVTKDTIKSIPRDEMFAPKGFKAVYTVEGKK